MKPRKSFYQKQAQPPPVKPHSMWFNETVSKVNLIKTSFSNKNLKKYRLPLLTGVAERLDEFSAQCGQCQLFQQELTSQVHNLGNIIQIDNKEQRKIYSKSVKKMVSHLQKQHKLVTEGHYTGIFTLMGTALGAAFGPVLKNNASGIMVGIAIGTAIGAILDARAKQEGRIIRTRDTKDKEAAREIKFSGRMGRIGIILGLAAAVAALLAIFIMKRYSG